MAATLPADLQQLMDAIDAADRAGASLAARLNDEEFQWKPGGGRRWSVAECLDHLAALNALYSGAIRGGIEKARRNGWLRRGPATLGFFGRRLVASQEPPVKTKLRSPEKVQPRPLRSRADVLRAYHDAHEEVRRVIRACSDIDVNRTTFSNPVLPILKVKISTALHVLPAHDRRHLWQAEQVEKEIRSAKC